MTCLKKTTKQQAYTLTLIMYNMMLDKAWLDSHFAKIARAMARKSNIFITEERGRFGFPS